MKNKTQTIQRIEMINFFYHHFVMSFHLKQTQKFFISKKKFNHYQSEIIIFAFQNFTTIIELIQSNLSNNWSFNEISNFEKGLLIIAISEFYRQNLAKNIVIAEAVKTAKKFGVPTAYAYINKVLEQALNPTNKDLATTPIKK